MDLPRHLTEAMTQFVGCFTWVGLVNAVVAEGDQALRVGQGHCLRYQRKNREARRHVGHAPLWAVRLFSGCQRARRRDGLTDNVAVDLVPISVP